MEGRAKAEKEKVQTKATSHQVRPVLMETSVARKKVKAVGQDCKSDSPLPARLRSACLQTSFYKHRVASGKNI
jgi:hypothetical protein